MRQVLYLLITILCAAVAVLAACSAAQEIPPSDFQVSIELGPCFGTCPVYSLSVKADGIVEYNGKQFVLFDGNHRATLPPGQVLEIYQAVLDAKFLSLEDRYEVSATDLPSILTTVYLDGDSKSVYHYGLGCGTDLDTAPPGLCHLEALLEQIPVSNGWVAP